jgi:hypothetical protein
MLKMTHKVWGGVYDFNSETRELSKVNRFFHTDGTVTHDRISYAYYESDYTEITSNQASTIDPRYFEITNLEGKTLLEPDVVDSYL